MRLRFLLFRIIFILLFASCESNVKLSPKVSRFIASEHLKKLSDKENLAKGVREFLHEEQDFKGKDSTHPTPTNIDPAYIPESNSKFPLPYYLIPREDVRFLYTETLDPRIKDQLILSITGKKHLKLFVHPESEAQYEFLRNAYNYVGPETTEFMATPTSSYRSLVVWNRNNHLRKPFIVKVSLDKNIAGDVERLISTNEIERSLANQKAIDQVGNKNFESIGVKFFPETAGIILEKSHPGAPHKLGGEIIREIPDELIDGKEKWFSMSSLMGHSKKTRPLIMDIIKKSGLTSEDFVKKYFIDDYMNMFEELSFKKGIQFEPHSQNLAFETNTALSPTGKWVIRDFNGILPDIMTMAKYDGPIDAYMEEGAATKFKLAEGRRSYVSSYVFFYKSQIFDMLLEVIAKFDDQMTSSKIENLKSKIDSRYLKMMNSYLGLNLKEVPNLSNFTEVEKMIIEHIELPKQKSVSEISGSDSLAKYIEHKKRLNEWIHFSDKKGKSQYYITNQGLFEVIENKVVGIAFYNRDEYESFKKKRINSFLARFSSTK